MIYHLNRNNITELLQTSKWEMNDKSILPPLCGILSVIRLSSIVYF